MSNQIVTIWLQFGYTTKQVVIQPNRWLKIGTFQCQKRTPLKNSRGAVLLNGHRRRWVVDKLWQTLPFFWSLPKKNVCQSLP